MGKHRRSQGMVAGQETSWGLKLHVKLGVDLGSERRASLQISRALQLPAPSAGYRKL
jgi:hypothetical protein